MMDFNLIKPRVSSLQILGHRPKRYLGLVDYVQKHVPSREGMAINSMALYARVVDDYGSVNLRIFFKYLEYMRWAKLVSSKPGDHVREILYWRKRC